MSKKKKKKGKATGALEQLESLYVDIMEILDSRGDKIIKKYPVLGASIRDYTRTVDQELSWLYEEANMILNPLSRVPDEQNYSLADFILGKSYNSPGNPTVVQGPVKEKKNGLGEGKRLFEEETE